nr:PREDICTED: protein piccolo-like [Stegastes partitus]
MPQPSPVPAKPETQAAPATPKAEPKTAPTKAEEKPGATKPQPVPAPIEAVPTVPTPKAKTEPTSVKMEAVATAASTQIEPETTPAPKIAKVSPVTAEKQPLATPTAEPFTPPMAPVQQPEVTPKVEVPNTDIPKTVTVEKKEEAVEMDISVAELPKAQESKHDLPEVKVDASAVMASATPMTAATTVPTETTAAEAVSGVVPETETKAQVSVPERIIKEVQPDDDIKLTKPAESLQQVEVQPTTQEQQLTLEVKPVREPESKEIADKLEEKITDITSAPESKPVPTKSIIIKDQDENKEESEKNRKVSLPAGQVQLENKVVPVTAIKPTSKEEHEEDQPQILPIVQEFDDGQAVSDASKDNISTDLSVPVKEEVKAERRRLSFQPMDESSGSELTPSPSPKVQRRRLKVSPVSSSSEDIKTESADSSIEDEEFIRKQIMGMGDEEEMSVSDEEKEKNSANLQAVKEVEIDNASVTATSLPRKGSTDNEDSPARKKSLPKTDTATAESVPETMPRTTFKKATPVMRQRQSTDEEVESITESLSKGSSSVQASSFTPGSSPTSASSLEEDSDSSPIHKKVTGDKHHRKGKHRQPTQPLPTIEDSSEEEQMRAHGQPLSPPGDASSTEDLRQVTVIDESHRTSGSEYSASIESEPEVRRAVQRGRKPSPTVIPYTPDPFDEKQTVTKSLKSAEEAYEEIIQKTKAIPGESPPDIEPLYGGMAIEDYLYESLVEEPEIKMSEFQEEEPKIDSGSESLKKLRSPEEVYEEMMQKKRELMMIEHEFQQAQTAMESSSSGASVTGTPIIAETCVVTIPAEETYLTGQIDTPPADTETLTEMPAKKKKRPAPPRPSEPPKRPEFAVVPSTPSGSIGFVRPMVPMDPALRKALFPIPDLKITQCSSGEEEDDSLADEYGIGISSDITPSDDSETKDDQSISPPLSEPTEMEPILVVCEIPEPKPIPTPISAPELTTTPSPVSPMSPPTSPATPDSSLASNATSSSSFQAQTPISSDSTPLSTPTPPTSFKAQSPPEIQLPATTAGLKSKPNPKWYTQSLYNQLSHQ